MLPASINVQSVALTVIAGLATIAVLRYAADVFIPLVLGVLASYALEPVVAALVQWRVPRGLAAALVLIALAGGFGATAWTLSDDAFAVVGDVPMAAQKLRQTLRGNPGDPEAPLEQVEKLANELERSAAAATPAPPPPKGVTRVQVEERAFDVRGYLWTGSMGLAGLVSQAILLFFLVYFLLAAGDLYRRKLVRIVGEPFSRKRITLEVLTDISRQVQRFLVLQVVTSALVGVLSWLAFLALGMRQAAVWGLLAGLFNSIPYFGPLLVTVGIAVVAFVQFGTLSMTGALAGVSFAITSLEGLLLTPWLVGRTARMNEVAIFVGLLFWAWMWGVVGMLLAVPMLMIAKSVCDHVEDLKPIGDLLGDD